MKLVTKIKDYYDFIIGQVWIDNSVIYLRNPKILNTSFLLHWPRILKDLKWWEYALVQTIAFCGEFVSFSYYEWKFHFWANIDLKKLDKEFQLQKQEYNSQMSKSDLNTLNRKNKILKEIHGKKTEVNNEIGSPIILLDLKIYCSIPDFENIIIIAKDFALDKYWFWTFMTPQDAYIKIYNFIIKNKDIQNNQTNKEKIISHWFDYKKSFRSNNK